MSAFAWKEMSQLFISNQVASIFLRVTQKCKAMSFSDMRQRIRYHKYYIQIGLRQRIKVKEVPEVFFRMTEVSEGAQ